MSSLLDEMRTMHATSAFDKADHGGGSLGTAFGATSPFDSEYTKPAAVRGGGAAGGGAAGGGEPRRWMQMKADVQRIAQTMETVVGLTSRSSAPPSSALKVTPTDGDGDGATAVALLQLPTAEENPPTTTP